MRRNLLRPRFSLLTLLLLMTIAGMGAALIRQAVELVPLREEVRELRDELGILHIDDPEKLYAIRVETGDPSFHKFRIYLPEGKKYSFNYAYDDIPVEGVTVASGTSPLQPGGYVVKVYKKDIRGPKSAAPSRQASMRINVVPTDGQSRSATNFSVTVYGNWVFNKELQNVHYSISGIRKEVENFSADESISLLRFREVAPINIKRDPNGKVLSYSTETIEEPCDGFLIWIEEEK